MNDIYELGNGEKWTVEDDAKPCPVCESMSYIFSNRFGPDCCIGCSDVLSNQMKAFREVET